MTTSTRELIRGLAGGVGFMIALLVLTMPWWLAGVLGVALYGGLSLVLPAAARPDDSSVAPGVTAKERDDFASQCGASSAALHQIASQLREGQFRTRVDNLGQTVASLTSYIQRKPESLISALELPHNLNYLVKLLRQYVELSQFPDHGPTVAEALQKVENTVTGASEAFDRMYQQLLNNDVVALKASATSLEYLLGVDTDLELHRKSAGLYQKKEGPIAPVPPRLRQPEKPL